MDAYYQVALNRRMTVTLSYLIVGGYTSTGSPRCRPRLTDRRNPLAWSICYSHAILVTAKRQVPWRPANRKVSDRNRHGTLQEGPLDLTGRGLTTELNWTRSPIRQCHSIPAYFTTHLSQGLTPWSFGPTTCWAGVAPLSSHSVGITFMILREVFTLLTCLIQGS